MLVKNMGKKCIGFGKEVILPDETKPLPAGYGETHPTVAFYLAKGYLVKVDPPAAEPSANPETGEGNENPPQVDPFALTDEQKAEAARKADIEAKIKAVGEMKNREPLRVEAAALGIEFKDTDTVEVLKQKVTEKLQAELG